MRGANGSLGIFYACRAAAFDFRLVDRLSNTERRRQPSRLFLSSPCAATFDCRLFAWLSSIERGQKRISVFLRLSYAVALDTRLFGRLSTSEKRLRASQHCYTRHTLLPSNPQFARWLSALQRRCQAFLHLTLDMCYYVRLNSGLLATCHREAVTNNSAS